MASEAPKTGAIRGTSSPSSDRWARRLLLTFVALSLVAVSVNVLIIIDVNSRIPARVNPEVASSVNSSDSHAVTLLQTLRDRLFILLAVTTSCFCLIIYLFARKAAAPLVSVLEAAREMSRGNLAINIPPDARNSVGELGRMVNEVAADFQEVVLLTGATVGRMHSRVDRLQHLLESEGDATHREQVREDLQELRRDLGLLHSVVKEFRLYQTSFDGQKVVPTGGHEEGGG